jgi:hypothetical protein
MGNSTDEIGFTTTSRTCYQEVVVTLYKAKGENLNLLTIRDTTLPNSKENC